MNYLLYWLLLGSLGLNGLWMLKARADYKDCELNRGFWLGPVMGPVTLAFFIYRSIKGVLSV